MASAIEIVERATDVLAGLAFVGAPFLLWARSRRAAILGACGGAAQLFTVLVFIAIDLASGDGPTMPLARVANIGLAVFGNLAFYGCLGAMVLVLAREAPEAR